MPVDVLKGQSNIFFVLVNIILVLPVGLLVAL